MVKIALDPTPYHAETDLYGLFDAVICSNVFAADESADETSRYQLGRIRELMEGAAA